MERDLKKIVSQMTLEEKAGMCSGLDFWHLKHVDRLGIPEVMVSDGPHGLRKQAEGCNCPELAELAACIDPLEDIKARIYAAVDPDAPSTLKDGGVIAKGYHAEVDELRSIRDNTKGVLAQLEARLRQETGIPKLKIGYNHVFGYFIEVSNSYKAQVPESYIRKQTLTTGERYILSLIHISEPTRP